MMRMIAGFEEITGDTVTFAVGDKIDFVFMPFRIHFFDKDNEQAIF